MQYPLISEYIESIRFAEENFATLKDLRPVLDKNGDPIMNSGNFAVVFKMHNVQTGQLFAMKCFLKEQEGREFAYRLITEELENVQSSFITSIKYIEKELFVDAANNNETEFPILLMDWVEGIPLDLYIDNCINDKYKLSQLAYRFSRLVLWLMPQPFAHGDLKPDNILVRTDGTLVLVDYDGMYVPAMKRQQTREIGSPDFRHPTRKIDNFDEHIDDFAISCILLSLKAISIEPTLYHQYAASGRLLFSEYDYRNFSKCEVVKQLYPSSDSEINILVSLFTIALERGRFDDVPFSLFYLREPKWLPQTEEEWDAFMREMELEHFPYEEAWSMSFNEFMKQNSIVTCRKGYAYCSLTDGGEEAFIFYTKNGKK